MRLWHIDLIPYLPKSQLLAQWRELNSIFKKQDKHILINYVYNDLFALRIYTTAIMNEFAKRKYRIKSFVNEINFFEKNQIEPDEAHSMRFKEHNLEYLAICYWNLREKYLRGQKDFTQEVWDKLDQFYQSEVWNKFKPQTPQLQK